MATYERCNDAGEVLERVTTSAGSHEDTRLGLAVLDGRGGWFLVGEAQPTTGPVLVGKTGPEMTTIPGGAQALDADTTAEAAKRQRGKRKD